MTMTFYFPSPRQAIMDAATRHGAKAVAVMSDDDHTPIAIERGNSEMLRVHNALDAVEVLQALAERGARYDDPNAVCVGFGEVSSQTAALVNSTMRWADGRYASFESLENMRDKYRLRRLMADKAPELSGGFALADGETELRRFLADTPAGVVVKPRDEAGSRHVHTITDTADLERIGNDIRYPVLVEERFVGPEFSVESMTWNRAHHPIMITQKRTGGQTGLVETGQMQPARITKTQWRALERAACTVLDVAGFEYGISHIEFMLEGDSPKLIEAHGRVGGDRIADLMRWSSGMDGFERVVDAYLTDHVEPARDTGMGARIDYADLTDWTGSDAAWVARQRSQPGVVEAVVLKPCDERGPITCSGDRHAFAVTTFPLEGAVPSAR